MNEIHILHAVDSYQAMVTPKVPYHCLIWSDGKNSSRIWYRQTDDKRILRTRQIKAMIKLLKHVKHEGWNVFKGVKIPLSKHDTDYPVVPEYVINLLKKED